MTQASPMLVLLVLLLANVYQFFTGPGTALHDVFGAGRAVQSINNHQCERIPELEACEDMWLHRKSGLLYLACSDTAGRLNWLPAVGNLNASGRPDTDYIAVVDTRAPGPISSRITKMTLHGFSGTLNLHGLDVWELRAVSTETKPTLRIFVNNHRPPIDPETGKELDATKFGANSTFELFETTLGDSVMRHIRTYAHSTIVTPNRPAATGPDSFLFTNDHKNKAGFSRALEPFFPGGSVGFCDIGGCHNAYSGLYFPNGIVRSSVDPTLFYLPSSSSGYIYALKLQANNTLALLDMIYAGYPSDNLFADSQDNIYTASFPKVTELVFKHFPNPRVERSPTTVLRISANAGTDRIYGQKYKIDKIFEDPGDIVSGVTTAVLDEQTNKLFLSAVSAPYTTVCQL